jgi:hypothetical protein
MKANRLRNVTKIFLCNDCNVCGECKTKENDLALLQKDQKNQIFTLWCEKCQKNRSAISSATCLPKKKLLIEDQYSTMHSINPAY